MTAPKYITRDASSGIDKEVLATETGPAAEVIVSTTSGGTIDASLLPAAEIATYTAGEALAAGDFVYIKSDGKAWKASAAVSGNPAIGFVLEAVDSAATATVYNVGVNTSLSTLTVGSRYYLSATTPGGAVATPVTGAGKLHQLLGIAVSATAIEFTPSDALLLAS